jgi:hypothetical protein
MPADAQLNGQLGNINLVGPIGDFAASQRVMVGCLRGGRLRFLGRW